MISDRQLADAILARKPANVRRIEIAYGDIGWCVTLTGGATGPDATCVSEVAPGLATALRDAGPKFQRALIADRNRAGVALAYAREWGAVA